MRQIPRFVHLSEQVIDSLKAFFDSIDIDKTGYVGFDQIVQRWRQFPPRFTTVVPQNFLETLARTVPPSGLVSFERFLAGVRIAIAEQKSSMKRVQSEGCNLHSLHSAKDISPPPLDHSNRDYMGSQPLYTTYNNQNNARRQQQPIMGVNKNNNNNSKLPPPGYFNGPSTASPVITSPDSNENYYRVQLRHKKNGHNKDSRVPSRVSNGFRPISTNSTTSNCSSSMGEIRWRDSRMSNASTPTTPMGDVNRHSLYLPEHAHQVTKHEKFLDEEFDTTRRGIETAEKLMEWYRNRLKTLNKRKEMLDKGMVALDSAVHEQKLNILRAQVTELNRKIQDLLVSNEKGFPSHLTHIRNPVPSANGTSNTSSHTSTCSTPEIAPSVLQTQNQRLLDELEAKSRLIEQLQREKRMFESQNGMLARRSYNPSPVNAYYVQSRATPTAYVKPALVQTYEGYSSPPVKTSAVPDTLL